MLTQQDYFDKLRRATIDQHMLTSCVLLPELSKIVTSIMIDYMIEDAKNALEYTLSTFDYANGSVIVYCDREFIKILEGNTNIQMQLQDTKDNVCEIYREYGYQYCVEIGHQYTLYIKNFPEIIKRIANKYYDSIIISNDSVVCVNFYFMPA